MPLIRILLTCFLWLGFASVPVNAQEATPAPESAPASEPTQTTAPRVLVQTNLGQFTIELMPEAAPESVANFLQYVDAGFYTNTLFHRVIRNFMIQAGQVGPDLKDKPTQDPIRNESGNGLHNSRGTVALARTMHPHSATSQFYINLVDNGHLDARPGMLGYAVFGRVVDGMDVVDRIGNVAVGFKNGFENFPLEPVVIEQIKRL